jgi:adenylate cyclase
MPHFRVLVYRSGKLIQTFPNISSLEAGRVDPGLNDPKPVALCPSLGCSRLVIAELSEVSIPRHWFKINAVKDGEYEIVNIHSMSSVPVTNDDALLPGETRRFNGSTLLEVGLDLAIRVESSVQSFASERGSSSAQAPYRTLESVPPTPGHDVAIPETIAVREFSEPEANQLIKLLRTALQVVQKAAGSDAFFQSAVAATTEIVDLDRTVLLLRDDIEVSTKRSDLGSAPAGWYIASEHVKDSGSRIIMPLSISASLLDRVASACATVIHDPFAASGGAGNTPVAHSLQLVGFAVASPILNQKREVIGVLYGDRGLGADAGRSVGINELEATLVEILAGSVAGGIARCVEERMRNTLTGFFSSKVADQLANDPTLMEGRDAEVTVLFCDLRGFSSVTEKLGPQKAIAWINDVMSELSGCVLERNGVLVDYVGDELLAMWGAPGMQDDHAALAIDAARAMLEKIEILRDRWADVLPLRFGAGIGINSGPARVGNVGSRQKFKYGPLGNTVNLGSRLQSATKQLGVNCIASHETVRAAGQLGDARQLANIGVVGIEEPVGVYEVVCQPSASWKAMTKLYHVALEQFHAHRLHEAARTLGSLLPDHPDDLPSRKLLTRVLLAMDEPTETFSTVLRLTSK